jgi:hypothetical protein
MIAASAPSPVLHHLALAGVESWTPEQRAAFCNALPLAVKWLEECKKRMVALLEAEPTAVPGWTLEPGSIKHPVRDIEELHNRFVASGGATAEFLKCCNIAKGDFEKAVREATKLKGKALNTKIGELLLGLTEAKQDRPSLARAQDTQD